MTQSSWDPAQYLRYSDERLRPALDLLAHVPSEAPARVVDLGCGPGNVTSVIRARFPQAEVTGVDGSEAMLAKARAAVPECRFDLADIAGWAPAEAPDVIFSNVALHWLGDHAALFPRLLRVLTPGGVLAVQMPAMHEAPLRALQYEVAANGPWAERLVGIGSAPPILAPGAYWDLLRKEAAAMDLWETMYWHVLSGEDAAAQWAAGTSLRPFLDALEGKMRAAYFAAYAEALRPHYPRRADGTTLLPFRRLFMVVAR
jgi:trans-aconitate 2-methyltransferase